ncbi:MAG: glycosyltransferase family 4 protein [Planctomycetota bacterium]|nr:glycosyltransferase family 4 protein [Planctomycetota bacterium]
MLGLSAMRILHISTRLILGGSQENTVLSCEGQAALGHDVHLAYGPIYGPEGSLFDRASKFRTADGRGIHMHEVPNMVRQVDPRHDAKCLRQLRALIRTIRPDVVHTHSSKAGILGRAAAWAEGGRPDRPADRPPIGVVHTIHGPPFHAHQNPLVKWAYIWAERYAARRCHLIAGVADAMTRQFLDVGIGRPEQYSTVYSGMEVERYLNPDARQTRAEMRAALSLRDDDFVIGSVARLAELKGHDDILDALGEDLHVHPTWKLLWVGDGWWRDRLLARVSAMGLGNRVITTGLVPSERVPGYMRAMDVMVHASYREGLPRTVPQALLCGTPVIATDVDGTREACIEGRTGKLVPLGDRAALRASVRWMFEHPSERLTLAMQGRELCRDRFSTQTMVRDLELFYAKAFAMAGGGAWRVGAGA